MLLLLAAVLSLSGCRRKEPSHPAPFVGDVVTYCRLIGSILEVSHPAPKLEEVITYAESNRETLVDKAVYLLDTFSKESGGFTLSRLGLDRYRKYSYHTRNEEEVVLPQISPLFDDGMIYMITVCSNAVEYSVGGTGIASNTTYYDLIYIPSGDVRDLFGYSDKFQFQFDDATGGYYGEIEGSDCILRSPAAAGAVTNGSPAAAAAAQFLGCSFC